MTGQHRSGERRSGVLLHVGPEPRTVCGAEYQACGHAWVFPRHAPIGRHTLVYQLEIFDAYSPFALVLTGSRELARRLALQPFESLVQRIDLRLHLSGMN